MYSHTHTHTDTYIYTHRHVQTLIHTYTCTYTEIQTHTRMYIYTNTHTHTSIHRHTHTPYKKFQYFLVHSQSRVLHSRRGREHSTHSFLCFHCTQLLSSLTVPSASDRSGLSSEPAQQDDPGGHTRPHHNFHSPLASRRVENSRPGVLCV
ncbi:unnamed protein product, partial [Staurois parvus]